MADTTQPTTTTQTQSTPAPVSVLLMGRFGTMPSDRAYPLSPEGWSALWADVRAERATGWKPDTAEQAAIDAAYKAGKAAGLGRQAKAPTSPEAKATTAKATGRSRKARTERLPSGQHVVLGVFHSPEGSPGAQRVYRRWFKTAGEAYEAVDVTLEALRAQMDKAGTKSGMLTITVKDYLLNETWTMKVPVSNEGKESYSFKQVAKLAPKAPPAKPAPTVKVAKPVAKPAPRFQRAAKPQSPNADIKSALKAALQGLAATQAAIMAAVNAL
jgi:hypothetical protein